MTTRSASPAASGSSGRFRTVGIIVIVIVAVVVTLMKQRGTSPTASSDALPSATQRADVSEVSAPETRASPSSRKPEASPAPAPGKPTTVPPVEPANALPTSTAAEIVLGFWNIEWLGKPEDRSGAGSGVAQDPADLADCIVQSKAAVVGLAEVVTRVVGRPLRSREIEGVIDAIKKKTGDRWEYTLNPGRSDGDQLTGVMWNTRVVTAVDASDRPWKQGEAEAWPIPTQRGRSSQGSGLWNRPPHAIKFSTGKDRTDFVLVVLHMKADYQGDFAAHRKEEADALVKALPAVREQFKDKDIVLIGDTNCIAPKEPGEQALVAAGFTDLNPGTKQTHWRGGTMDRAFIPSERPAFKNASMSVMSDVYLRSRGLDPREYKRRFSDHYMITTILRPVADDD